MVSCAKFRGVRGFPWFRIPTIANTRKTMVSPMTRKMMRRIWGALSDGVTSSSTEEVTWVWSLMAMIKFFLYLLLAILVFLVFTHQFFNSRQFCTHGTHAHRDHCEIAKQSKPDNGIGY